jgi:chromosome segregation ATPase
MNKLFSTLHLNSNFIILVGIFLFISFFVTIIIVFFLSKIKTLNSILEKAKKIDKAKITKIARLEKELNEAKSRVAKLSRDLLFLPKNKEKLEEANRIINKLREELSKNSKENLKTLHKQKVDFEQLNVHYELLSNNYYKLEYKYKKLKDQNESLREENEKLNKEMRENLIKQEEQLKDLVKKITENINIEGKN